jgi:hypothetical protein
MGLRDLTVVVVVDDVDRDVRLDRLRAMSRQRQEGAVDVDLEVLVVDASVDVGARLDSADLRALGDEFVLVDAGDASTTAGYLNEAMRPGRGRVFLVVTDAARPLPPQAFARGLAADVEHGPAVTVIEHESGASAVFVPRALLEQVGCLDERLMVAGAAGYDSEFIERVTVSPGLAVVTMDQSGRVEVEEG